MQENLYTPDCIRTHSGLYFNVVAPRPDQIDIKDIAWALSRQCRFGAHAQKFYTVAEHSLQVAWHSKNKRAGLMHDAAEAYLLDLPSPIKANLPGYKLMENKIMLVIAEKFGFDWPMPLDVQEADKLMLEREWANIMIANNWSCMTHKKSFKMFMQHFHIYFA